MNQEPQEGMIPKYLIIAAIGLMVAIGIWNTRDQTESPAELRRKPRPEVTGSPAELRRKPRPEVTGSGWDHASESSGLRNHETPQRQTAKGVTVRLASCHLASADLRIEWAGTWLCERTGGDLETARWTVWSVMLSRPADGATLLSGPAEFICPGDGFTQKWIRRRCTAKERTFFVLPVY